MIKLNKPVSAILAILFLFIVAPAKSQDVVNDFQGRAFFRLSLEPIKQLSVDIIPEARFEDDFSVDEYQLETELTYKPFSFFHLGGSYRFIINYRNKKETEYLHRYSFFTKFKKDFGDFTPSLRVMYTNYTDDAQEGQYMRYKAMLKYDIPKCNLTPSLSAELFHYLEDQGVYKMRYKLKLAYEIFNNNYVEVSYRLDNYSHANRNRHIVSLGYELKL